MTLAQEIVETLTEGNPEQPELPLDPSIELPASLVRDIAQKSVRAYIDSLKHGKPVFEHSVHDHGIMISDYFQGAGTAYTQWDNAYTGTGENGHEAMDDALENAAQDGWDVRNIENPFDPNDEDTVTNCVRAQNPGMEDDDLDTDNLYYYVSVYVRGVPEAGEEVEEAKRREPAPDILHQLGQVAIDAGKKKFEVGQSVSRGTAATEDLLFAFLGALEELDKAKFHEVQQVYSDEIAAGGRVVNGTANDGDYEVMNEFVNETLDNIMQKYCPPGTYFGPSEGDGTDYGCWPLREDEIVD